MESLIPKFILVVKWPIFEKKIFVFKVGLREKDSEMAREGGFLLT